MGRSEIDAVRALLGAKPRPVGWAERRRRLDEVGSFWPVADDVKCEAIDLDGVPGEWPIPPDASPRSILLYLHGGGWTLGWSNVHLEAIGGFIRERLAPVSNQGAIA